MNVIIGGGIAGLILSKRVPNSVILEMQPVVGGLYSSDEIAGYEISILPPIVRNVEFLKKMFDAHYEIFRPEVIYEKEQFLKDKICKECEALPPWLDFSSQLFWINNIKDFIMKLHKGSRIVYEYPANIYHNKILTNKGKLIQFEKLINTGSRAYINKLLGIKENLGSKSLFLTILITSSNSDKNWNVYINGHSGFTISHIIRKELEKNVYVNYIYAFFSEKLLDVKKIFSELKRLRLLSNESIIGFRTHVIKEAILFGEPIDNGLINSGRLGLWRNLTLEETIDLAHRLQI